MSCFLFGPNTKVGMLLPLTRLDFVERPSPARRGKGSGAPDFQVMKAAMILGYVEDKTIGENLDQILLNRIRNDGTVVPSCHLIRRARKDIVRFVLANSTEPSKLHAKESFVSLGEEWRL